MTARDEMFSGMNQDEKTSVMARNQFDRIQMQIKVGFIEIILGVCLFVHISILNQLSILG